MQKTADEIFLRSLATVVADNPRRTFGEIARAAGVSKSTLNRFCGTYENLIMVLVNHIAAVTSDIVGNSNLQSAEPVDALHSLIDGHLAHQEILPLLSFQCRLRYSDGVGDGVRWSPYSEALDRFFLRGQSEGFFRLDIGAPVLADLFLSIIVGLVSGERRGRIERVDIANLMQQFFVDGAASRLRS